MGELFNEEKIIIGDIIEYYMVNGNVVYGGGGIYLDVFVVIDMILLNKIYIGLC